MEPVRSSLGAGVIASLTLAAVLLVTDALLSGTDFLLFATFRSLCVIGGPPYCELGSPTATLLTYIWYGILFVVAWPLLFGGFTWGLPGESGLVHGAVFGLVLWSGYVVVVLFGIGFGGQTVAENLPLLSVTLVAYLVYGLVLGGGYDFLAEHRTFLSGEQFG